MTTTANNGAVLTNVISATFGIILLAPIWLYGTSYLIPVDHRFDFGAVASAAWQARPDIGGYLAWLAPQLEAWDYPWAFLATVVPSVVAVSCLIAVSHGTRRSPWHALAGSVVGASLGFLASRVLALPEALSVLAMPGLGFGVGVLAPMALAPERIAEEVSVVRGTRIMTHRAQTKSVNERARKQGRVAVADVLIEDRKAETTHYMIIGATGTGKSTVINQLMVTALERRDRMVVVDPRGEAMSHFYRDGDTILNPFDARSAKWDLLGEIRTDSDYSMLAETIMPVTGVSGHDEWLKYARDILADCLRAWHLQKLGTSDAFVEAMSTATTEQLALLTEGRSSHRYFEEGSEKMLAGTLSTMSRSLGGLQQMAAVKGPAFSIRDWIRNGTGSLWMPYQDDERADLRGPVSCWTSIAIGEMQNLEEDPTDARRVWFFVDELDGLGKLARLKDAMVRLRKVGGPVVLALQSIAMVRSLYGDAEAQAIVEQADNKLVLRCGMGEGGGTAKFASDLIGEREVEREEVTTSHTKSPHPTSSTTVSTRRHVEKAVLPAEITQLRTRTGFLKLGDRDEWLRVAFSFKRYPTVTARFVRTGPVTSDKAQ